MLKKTHDYDDIINKPRPDQSERGKITDEERAEMFAAFEALNSPDEHLEEDALELFCDSGNDDIKSKKRKERRPDR